MLYAFVIFIDLKKKCVYVVFIKFLVVLILQLIASVVLICKSLLIKASAK